jgi:hypothetical protein
LAASRTVDQLVESGGVAGRGQSSPFFVAIDNESQRRRDSSLSSQLKSDERETLFKGFPTQVFAMSQERWKKIGGA